MQTPAALPPHIETYGPLSYPQECFAYSLFGGTVHVAFFLAGVLVLGALSIIQGGHFLRWQRRWAVFNLSFFVAASLVNGAWSCLVFGRLYWSTDYVSDFLPFWPITQSVLDARFGDQAGGLLGISLLQLQALWVPFAACAWIFGYAGYRRFITWRALPILATASN